MSSVRNVSKRSHRMAEVSAARFILGGLVGPKPRPKGVGDGQLVSIPAPPTGRFKVKGEPRRITGACLLDMVRPWGVGVREQENPFPG